jgi:phage terminase large subunit-like protein
MLYSLGLTLTLLGLVALLAVPAAGLSDLIAHTIYGSDR